MSSNFTVPVREGEVLSGKYRIERLLGVGGMGAVVAAYHLQLDERVAMKFLLPEALHHPDAVTRFVREARAAIKIKSEHVARVLDVGELESGIPFIVMEYLEGANLAALLRERGAFAIDIAVDFVIQALEAVAEAHALGIVHRDLKPSNLFCIRRSDGVYAIKVLDFGISKISHAALPSGEMDMTKTADVMGSPLYMSPEQLRSARDVDAGTDIWAIGVILYELLVASVPFQAPSFPELCMTILSTAPAPIHAVRPDVSAGLERVILRCLEKDRARRFSDVGELAEALGSFASPRGRPSIERIVGVMRSVSRARGDRPQSQPTSLPDSRTALGGRHASPSPSVSERPVEPAYRTLRAEGPNQPRRPTVRRVLVLGAAGGVAIVVGVLFFIARNPPPSAATSSSAAIAARRAPSASVSPAPKSPSPVRADPVASIDAGTPGAGEAKDEVAAAPTAADPSVAPLHRTGPASAPTMTVRSDKKAAPRATGGSTAAGSALPLPPPPAQEIIDPWASPRGR